MAGDFQQPRNVFGSHPKGFRILTREGRSIVVTTAENRRAGAGDAERAALHKSMLAYSGKYRVEGHDFITVVDVSWNEEWNGTEQGGTFEPKATSSSSSRHRRRESSSQARQISAESSGNERSNVLVGHVHFRWQCRCDGIR